MWVRPVENSFPLKDELSPVFFSPQFRRFRGYEQGGLIRTLFLVDA